MQPFAYSRALSLDTLSGGASGAPPQMLAGGTTLLDLMKLDVMQPRAVLDINPLASSDLGEIDFGPRGLRLGALVRMADAAKDDDIQREYPVLAQSLQLAASAQIRNMATLGGNLMQRTRCPYFRDVSYEQCNKRNPGSGCAALDGFNRMHAVLGTSNQCIATYPGDFAQALLALDANIEIAGARGSRTIPVSALHRLPDTAPQVESNLRADEMIVAISVPASDWARRSVYVKARDRDSYEFALASAAVALDIDGSIVRNARVALGGVATVPWRSAEAESALKGAPIDEAAIQSAAAAAFRSASPREHNAYKIELGKRVLADAISRASKLDI